MKKMRQRGYSVYFRTHHRKASSAKAGTRQSGYRTGPLHHLHFVRISSKPHWTAAAYQIFPIYFIYNNHYRKLAFYTSSIIPTLLFTQLYQSLCIKSIYQNKTVDTTLEWEVTVERTIKQCSEPHSPTLAMSLWWVSICCTPSKLKELYYHSVWCCNKCMYILLCLFPLDSAAWVSLNLFISGSGKLRLISLPHAQFPGNFSLWLFATLFQKVSILSLKK